MHLEEPTIKERCRRGPLLFFSWGHQKKPYKYLQKDLINDSLAVLLPLYCGGIISPYGPGFGWAHLVGGVKNHPRLIDRS